MNLSFNEEGVSQLSESFAANKRPMILAELDSDRDDE